MNSELQAQTDAIIKAITSLETTMHQDAVLAAAIIGILLVVLIVIVLFKR